MDTVTTSDTVINEPVSTDDTMPATETVAPQPINEEFGHLLGHNDDHPGPPFFDATLNFLDDQHRKVSAEAGRLRTKKYKLEDEIRLKDDEQNTVATLLIEEFRERQPRNPETGELVDPPFAEHKDDAPEPDDAISLGDTVLYRTPMGQTVKAWVVAITPNDEASDEPFLDLTFTDPTLDEEVTVRGIEAGVGMFAGAPHTWTRPESDVSEES